jgi:hypothetical protein
MHSNVMLRFMVQALKDPPLCRESISGLLNCFEIRAQVILSQWLTFLCPFLGTPSWKPAYIFPFPRCCIGEFWKKAKHSNGFALANHMCVLLGWLGMAGKQEWPERPEISFSLFSRRNFGLLDPDLDPDYQLTQSNPDPIRIRNTLKLNGILNGIPRYWAKVIHFRRKVRFCRITKSRHFGEHPQQLYK